VLFRSLAAQPGTTPAIELRGIDKWFGSVHANNNISFAVPPGTIHGIIGHAARTNGSPAHVVASSLEHNAIVRPLHTHVANGEAILTRIGIRDTGEVDIDALIGAVNERTELVIVTAASNATGILQPIEEIGARLREKNTRALLFVDGAQAIGAVPIDVLQAHIDILAIAGHKALMGPTGVGAMYVSERVYDPSTGTDRMPSARQGGTGSDAPNPAMPSPLPMHYEAGTMNTVGFAGLLAAMEAVDGERESILAHERALVSTLIGAFRDNPRLTLAYPDNMNRTGVLSFAVPDGDIHEIATVLDESFGIAVRPGIHCAPWAHEAAGTLRVVTDTNPPLAPPSGRGFIGDGMIRVSPGWKTTVHEIERFIGALKEVLDALVVAS